MTLTYFWKSFSTSSPAIFDCVIDKKLFCVISAILMVVYITVFAHKFVFKIHRQSDNFLSVFQTHFPFQKKFKVTCLKFFRSETFTWCTLGNYDLKTDFSFLSEACFENKVASQSFFKIGNCNDVYKAIRRCYSLPTIVKYNSDALRNLVIFV